MSNIKIAAAILILGSGLAGSYFIVKNSVPSVGFEKKDIGASEQIKDIISGNPLTWENSSSSLDSLNKFLSNFNSSSSFISGDNGSSLSQAPQNNSNFTNYFAQSLFEKMKMDDQSGKDPFANLDLKNPDNQKLVQNMANSVQNPSSLFDQSVSDQEIIISRDNSKDAKSKYMESIGQISQNRLSDPKYLRSADQITQDINQDCFSSNPTVDKDLSDSYALAASDYLGLSVPSDWQSLHKQIISYFKKANLIYSALSNCSKDPVKGYLAIESLPQLISQAKGIQNLITIKAGEINL